MHLGVRPSLKKATSKSKLVLTSCTIVERPLGILDGLNLIFGHQGVRQFRLSFVGGCGESGSADSSVCARICHHVE